MEQQVQKPWDGNWLGVFSGEELACRGSSAEGRSGMRWAVRSRLESSDQSLVYHRSDLGFILRIIESHWKVVRPFPIDVNWFMLLYDHTSSWVKDLKDKPYGSKRRFRETSEKIKFRVKMLVTTTRLFCQKGCVTMWSKHHQTSQWFSTKKLLLWPTLNAPPRSTAALFYIICILGLRLTEEPLSWSLWTLKNREHSTFYTGS